MTAHDTHESKNPAGDEERAVEEGQRFFNESGEAQWATPR